MFVAFVRRHPFSCISSIVVGSVCLGVCVIYMHSTYTGYFFFAVTKYLTAARSSLGRIYFGSQMKIERQAQTDRQIGKGYHDRGGITPGLGDSLSHCAGS